MISMPLGYGFPSFQRQRTDLPLATEPTKSGGPLCPACSGPFVIGQRAMLTVSMVEEGRTDFVATHEVCF